MTSLKKRRSQRPRLKPSQLLTKFWRPLLGLLLAAVGMVFILNPFRLYVTPYTTAVEVTNPGLGDKLPHWIAYENGAAIIGITLIVAAFVWWAILMRDSINNTSTLWSDACPHCHHSNLKRVHRHLIDRLCNLFGFPVRRYLCERCGWKGARIDRSQLLR